MKTAIITTALLLLGWIAWKLKTAPRGYQDHRGYHEGEE